MANGLNKSFHTITPQNILNSTIANNSLRKTRTTSYLSEFTTEYINTTKEQTTDSDVNPVELARNKMSNEILTELRQSPENADITDKDVENYVKKYIFT